MIAPKLTFFIMLQALKREDQFVIEVVWGEDGEFPFGSIGEIIIDPPQGRERLRPLWEKGNREPVWDISPETTLARQDNIDALARGEHQAYPADLPIEQVLPRVCKLSADAVQKLIQYELPLFRQVAEHRGLSWPLHEGQSL